MTPLYEVSGLYCEKDKNIGEKIDEQIRTLFKILA